MFEDVTPLATLIPFSSICFVAVPNDVCPENVHLTSNLPVTGSTLNGTMAPVTLSIPVVTCMSF